MKAGENETERVDLETNRVFVGEDVLGGTLPRSTYGRLLTSKFTVAGCMKIMKVIVKYMLRKRGLVLSDTELEAENWRILSGVHRSSSQRKREKVYQREKSTISDWPSLRLTLTR